MGRVSAEQHLPKPKAEDNGSNERSVLGPILFYWHANTGETHGTHITMSIRVKRTDFVPSIAIPLGISYLGTKEGNDDKIALSSLGGALATLEG